MLGGSGMLGSMVADYLSKDKGMKVAATVRNKAFLSKFEKTIPNVKWSLFDAGLSDLKELECLVKGKRWVINAIGVTKYYIDDNEPQDVERAININASFPFKLARAAELQGGRVLQIATDCVYSGVRGSYVESDLHDPYDVYGKTKSLGETFLPNSHFLRCSFIGPEPKAHVLLLEWFRRQPKGVSIDGYVNHNWNGVTTLHVAKLYHGIISQEIKLPHLQHIIPQGTITKADLLKCLAREYNRKDIVINPIKADKSVDRVLSTQTVELNNELWNAAGYSAQPSICQMVEELAEYNYRME